MNAESKTDQFFPNPSSLLSREDVAHAYISQIKLFAIYFSSFAPKICIIILRFPRKTVLTVKSMLQILN